MRKKQFVEKFNAALAARQTLGEQADWFCSFLRGYALTINDHTFTEAADLIDELFGAYWESEEELAGHRGEDV